MAAVVHLQQNWTIDGPVLERILDAWIWDSRLPAATVAALADEVRRLLLAHPGDVAGALRWRYPDGVRHEGWDRQPERWLGRLVALARATVGGSEAALGDDHGEEAQTWA